MIMSTFGSLSKGERNRIRIRVRAAMAAQAQTEGRFLGGRPPYGYLLIDAGPHPNPGQGRRRCTSSRTSSLRWRFQTCRPV
jgi:site-specific DNA recombinase